MIGLRTIRTRRGQRQEKLADVIGPDCHPTPVFRVSPGFQATTGFRATLGCQLTLGFQIQLGLQSRLGFQPLLAWGAALVEDSRGDLSLYWRP